MATVRQRARVRHIGSYGDVQPGQEFDAPGEEAKRNASNGLAKNVEAAGGGEGAEKFDAENASKADLVAEAERRNLTVTRADGKDGEPLVEDYRRALSA